MRAWHYIEQLENDSNAAICKEMCLPGIKHILQLDQKTTIIPMAVLESFLGYFIQCPALTHLELLRSFGPVTDCVQSQVDILL